MSLKKKNKTLLLYSYYDPFHTIFHLMKSGIKKDPSFLNIWSMYSCTLKGVSCEQYFSDETIPEHFLWVYRVFLSVRVCVNVCRVCA